MNKALRLIQRKLKQPYHLWLFGRLHRLVLVLGIPVLGSVMAKLVGTDRVLELLKAATSLNAENASVIPLLFHGLVLLGFAFWRPRLGKQARDRLPSEPAGKERVLTAVGQFTRLWRLMWFSWSLYYLAWAFTISSGYNWNSTDQPPMPIYIASTSLSSFANLLLVAVYLVLSEKTVDGNDARTYWDSVITWAVFFTAYVIVDGIIAHNSPSLASLSIRRTIVGITSGLLLAMFAGRLDNKVLAPPYWVVIVQYVYALIQTSYVKFNNPTIMLTMTFIALLCNVILFTFVLSLFCYGQIIDFAIALRPLIDARDAREKAIKTDELRDGY